MDLVVEKILKGGSLNNTVLCKNNDGVRFVRKSISRSQDREYGFTRWYSQFKCLQRFNVIFPELFPTVLGVGTTDEQIFFDIEYFETASDVKTFLSSDPEIEVIAQLEQNLWAAMDSIHNHTTFSSFSNSFEAYFAEEVTQRLNDAFINEEFKLFCQQKTLVINQLECSSLLQNFDWLKNLFDKLTIERECYTHGNITLENILFDPLTKKIIFIDPYEENMIDCPEAEYSQILQCCNQCYGFINDRLVDVKNNEVSFNDHIPASFDTFHMAFNKSLEKRVTSNQLLITRFLEATQFIRMLPFKILAGEIQKAKYFFCVASILVEKLKNETI